MLQTLEEECKANSRVRVGEKMKMNLAEGYLV